MKTRTAIVAIAVVTLLNACAFGTRTANLSYPPDEDDGGGLISSAKAAEAPSGQAQQVRLSVTDERSKRERIGNVRNTFGMDTADVVTNDDVQAWVDEALMVELENAGYEIVRSTDPVVNDDVIALDAEILEVYCDVYLTYDGDVSLLVTLEREGQEPVKRQFEGEGSVGLNWAATAASYSESLALALQDAISEILVEVAAYQ